MVGISWVPILWSEDWRLRFDIDAFDYRRNEDGIHFDVLGDRFHVVLCFDGAEIFLVRQCPSVVWKPASCTPGAAKGTATPLNTSETF